MEDTVVLVVDRDDAKREETVALLEAEFPGATVRAAATQAAAVETVGTEHVDVLVTGYTLPDGNGLELVKSVRADSPETGCILYTTTELIDTTSFEDLVVEFVAKDAPDAREELLALVRVTGPERTQTPYPVPDDEASRAAAAREVDGEAPPLEPSLERLAEVGLAHFEADAVALSLVLQDEQTVLARAGTVEIPTSREESLATHALVSPSGSLVVADTGADPRFADVDAIQSAGIGSYLGRAIEGPGGRDIGALSVYTDEPREYTDAEQATLGHLAELAGDLFRLQTERERE